VTVEGVEGSVDPIANLELLAHPLGGEADGPACGQEIGIDALPRVRRRLGATGEVGTVQFRDQVGFTDIPAETGHRGEGIAMRDPRVEEQPGEAILGGQTHIGRQGPADSLHGGQGHQTDYCQKG